MKPKNYKHGFYVALSLAFCSLILVISCKKYPEDPSISFKRPGKRLEGKWKFVSYKINGTEHSHDFDHYITPYTLSDCFVKFMPSNDPSQKYLKGSYKIFTPNNVYIGGVRYDLGPSANDITLVCDTGFAGHLLLWYSNSPPNWRIRELYKTNLHLRKNNVDIYFRKE